MLKFKYYKTDDGKWDMLYIKGGCEYYLKLKDANVSEVKTSNDVVTVNSGMAEHVHVDGLVLRRYK